APEVGWRYSEQSAERTREVALIAEACACCDVCDGALALAQRGSCQFQTTAARVLADRHTLELAKRSRDVTRMQPQRRGDVAKRLLFAREVHSIVEPRRPSVLSVADTCEVAERGNDETVCNEWPVRLTQL